MHTAPRTSPHRTSDSNPKHRADARGSVQLIVSAMHTPHDGYDPVRYAAEDGQP
jgi:hypothetical protein